MGRARGGAPSRSAGQPSAAAGRADSGRAPRNLPLHRSPAIDPMSMAYVRGLCPWPVRQPLDRALDRGL